MAGLEGQLVVRILGPLEVDVGGAGVALGGHKQRAVLALLATRAGTSVSTDTLIESLWPKRPPATATTTVQVYVSRLRKLVGPDAIVREAGGYRLCVDGDDLDGARFERLVALGRDLRASGRTAEAADALTEALSIWRGPALADFVYESWAQAEIARLEERRLASLEERIEVDLELGCHSELIGELETLVAEQPLRERLRSQLMLALYRAGRPAEALETYQSYRRLLDDELGIEPSAELKHLERRILQQDSELAPAAAALPTGTVTMLFTDIEGSTRLLERLGLETYGELLELHRRLIRQTAERHAGREVDSQGDAFFVVFRQARDALAFATDVQQELAAQTWPEQGEIRLRIGVHTGEPAIVGGRYVGIDLHRAARIAAAGHGGQILLSETTRDLVDSDVELHNLGEHRLRDLGKPEKLYQFGDEEFPPLMTLDATNLPVATTRLLGRERELGEVRDLLSEHRLVTITGAGGTGKTRLALQVAAELVGSVENGVFWVPFAAISDPRLVETTIAQTLGARVELNEFLRGKELLLLLDNFEHLLVATVALSELLAGSKGLRLLVTSRAPLHASGEYQYPLDPLPETDAVTLFLERSRAAGRLLEPVDTVEAICRRLDGLPLAIELAAVRTKLLSPETLLRRLEHALPLLSGGARDVPERQQTLRATIEWSYDLLSEDEQQLFRRLSVFAGGCTLEAAEEVCRDDLDTLQSLVENSLLRFSNERYWMLETIREYAGERLEESGEAGDARQRHADRFLTLGEEAAPFLMGADAGRWFDRLEEDLDNIRMALDFFALIDPERELRLATDVSRLWWVRGYLVEGRRRLEGALERAAPSAPTVVRAAGLHMLEFLASSQGDYEGGRAFAEEALRIHRDLGDEQAAAGVLNTLGANAMSRGDHGLAQSLFEQSRTIFAEVGNEWGIAMTVGNLGELALETGDLRDAVEHLEQSNVLNRRGGWDEARVSALCALGAVRLEESRSADAFEYFRESVELADKLGHIEGIADCLEGFAGCASVEGNPRRAARLLGAAASLREDARVSSGSYLARYGERQRKEVREGLGDEEFSRAVDEGRAMSVNAAVDYASDPLD